MNAVTSGNLIISSDLNISEIQEFDMKIEKNCHTAARITGCIPDETGESPVLQKLEGSSVTISAADERGNKAVPPIFCGFIRNVEIWQEGNGYKARIEAISPTELLDLKEKSRSFQKIDMTYKEHMRRYLNRSMVRMRTQGLSKHGLLRMQQENWCCSTEKPIGNF